MKKIKITPQTYIDMNEEMEKDDTPLRIVVPTQEAIDKWESQPSPPYQTPPHVDMVANMWKKHREQPKSGPEADKIAGLALIRRAGGLLDAKVEYLDNKIVITYG
jgi:hypothetical protein|tara:strand:- start:1220 stop:1534 length:315 start_codon:yes stop_codon:yes gene_type:complete